MQLSEPELSLMHSSVEYFDNLKRMKFLNNNKKCLKVKKMIYPAERSGSPDIEVTSSEMSLHEPEQVTLKYWDCCFFILAMSVITLPSSKEPKQTKNGVNFFYNENDNFEKCH